MQNKQTPRLNRPMQDDYILIKSYCYVKEE